MTEHLGSLEYDLKISEEELKKNIESIEAELLKFTKKAEKALTIDVKKNKFLTAQEKILRQINQTETQGIVNKHKTLQAQEKTIREARRGAQEAKKNADANLLAEQRLQKAKNLTVASQIRLNNLQKRSVSGIAKVNSAYRSQGLHLQNLNTLAANYISIFAVLNLSKQIAKITGEFELQRKALAAIIQSKEDADRLFDKVTDLALVSPFAIKDLLGYTKMLAAYRIESDQLIGTLSKLGDVSAGLGVDMSRLILAFGQVKAASVLRGQELRQFTEAGIPLIALLADKFSELEGRVVSTNEVFAKISKRMVGFKMVSDIFDDMTKKGGIFFEAQRVQAETIAGMMSIFTDAMHKAFAAIGDENESLIKGVISGATGALDNWREILRVVRILVATIGIYKVSLLVLNKQRAIGNVLMQAGVTNIKALTFAQKRQIVAIRSGAGAWSRLGLSMRKVGAFMKSNALLLGITAVVALGTAIYEASVEANRLGNELRQLAAEEFVKTENLVDNFEKLARASVESTDGSKAQRDALAELNRTYKEYLPAQSMNIENLKKLKGNYDLLTKSIYNKTRARAAEKLQEKIETSFQEETTEQTKSLIAGLVNKDILKRDAVNIIKIFREEFEKDVSQDAGKLLQSIVDEYTGGHVALTQKVISSTGMVIRTEYSKAAKTVYKLANAFRDMAHESEKARNELSAIYDTPDVEFQADAEALELLTKIYAKEKEELINRRLSAEEYTEAVINLNKKELQSKIEYFETMAQYGDEAYKTDQIKKFKAELDALINTGGNFQELVKSIIQEAGGTDIIVRKLAVKEDEDPTTFIKRIQAEYKDYNALIKQTEGIVSGYRKSQSKGWKEAVKTAEEELEVLNLGLKVTKAIADGIGITLGKKSDINKKDKEAVDQLKAQLKLYKEIIATGKKLSKVMGLEDVNKQLKDLFSQQAKELGITIPMEFDTPAVIEAMQGLADKAEKIGGDTGKKWSKGVNLGITKLQVDDITEAAKKSLKEIDDEIKAYQTKNAFYEYIFGVTKDKEFSFKIAFDADTTSLDQVIRDNISEIDTEISLKLGDRDTLGKSFTEMFDEQEVEALEKRVGSEKVALLKKLYEQLAKIRQDSFKTELKNLYKATDEFASNEEKKRKIAEKYAKLRAAIEVEYANLSSEEKAKMLKNMARAESDEISAIDAVILASTQSYKELYSDMERFSVKKMKNIRDKWIEILADVEKVKPDKEGKMMFEIDGKTVELTEKQIERLKKAVLKLDKEITNKNPFEKIAAGFKKLTDDDGENNTEAFELIAEGAGEVLEILSPLADAFGELAEATDNDSMRNFAQDMQLAITWGKQLMDLGVGISKAFAGDPTALIGSLVSITTTLLKAEAEYQKAKRAFMADTIKMQRAYVILLLEEQALFKEGTSIFGLNEFGRVSNNLTVLKSATEEYRKEILNLGDAMVKTGVKRKKFLGMTVGKEDIYGQLLTQFPELIKNQDELIKKTEEFKRFGVSLSRVFYEVGENAEIDINIAKSILATEKLTDAARATLEQLISIQEQIDEANEAISSYLQGVFGDIGTELSDALVQAFREGNDAGIDFADNMTKTMDRLAQDIANSMILAPYFKDFEEKLNQVYKDISLSPEEQLRATTSLMADFYSGLKDEQEEYNKFLQQSQDIAREYGIDLFADTTGDLSKLTQGIESLSEDTGRRLEALFNSNREINIQNSTTLTAILGSMRQHTLMASQVVTIMQTMNQNIVKYIETFDSVLMQGSGGRGIKAYVQ